MCTNSVNNQKGFTLFEMLVSLSIVALIASISLYGLTSYTQYFALKDSARTLEGVFREAQDYAVNIQDIRTAAGMSSDFAGRFGVAVAVGEPIILFSDDDTPANIYAYDGPIGGTAECKGECVSKTPLKNSVSIKKICYYITANNLCQSDDGWITAVFVRPSLDAHINAFGVYKTDIEKIEITLESTSGYETTVSVGATGYISNT